MTKFRIGDRVRIYGFYHCAFPVDGTVKDLRDRDGRMLVSVEQTGNGGVKDFKVHEKQCRKLVKRQRLELWVVLHADGQTYRYCKSETDAKTQLEDIHGGRIVHMREVREKK